MPDISAAPLDFTEMAELLLEQFAKRADQESDAAWNRRRTFNDAAEKVSDRRFEMLERKWNAARLKGRF